MPDGNQTPEKPPQGPPGPNGPKGPMPPRMRMTRGLMGWIGIGLIALMIVVVVKQSYVQPQDLSIDEFWKEAENNRFEEIVISDDRFTETYRDKAQGQPRRRAGKNEFMVRYNTMGRFDEVETKVRSAAPATKIKYEESNQPLFNMLIGIIPWLLIFAFIWFVVIRQIRSSAGGAGMLGNFGRSRHRVSTKELANVTFKDVAGVEEAKEEVHEIVEFLKNPKRFQRLGGRIPRGVLLVGDPGCGKTLLAKAMAGEADVPFFSISGSDFVEMFVGVGASRVRDLFKQAKESSPCIIFMDEIDAVGRRRGNGFSSGGHDEREQTLNAILVEMDGFESSDQVIVIASTNRADVLDPALTRPGRFDRQVTVPLPDLLGRVEILKVHSRKIKLSPDVDLERAARTTPMFSGAELAALINEAAIGATLQDKEFVEQEDLEEARDKIRFGRANKSRKVEQDERVATAYHEAGHAVVQYLLPAADPLHKVTIIPRGRAGGMTMSLPEKDRYGYGYKYIHDTMRVLCGGRIAEAKKTDDISSGASMDIQMMTQFARAMVLDWGMSKRLGFVQYRPEDNPNAFMAEKPYSDETAHIIDEEIKRFSDEAFAHAEQIIAEHWTQTVALAEALLKYETLSREEVEKIMKGEPLRKATVAELLAAESEKKVAPDSNRPAPAQRDEDEGTNPGLLPSPA